MRYLMLLLVLGCGDRGATNPWFDPKVESKPNEAPTPGFFDRPRAKSAPKTPFTWAEAKPHTARDDVLIECPWAKPLSVTGDRFGQWHDFGTCLVVKLRVTNADENQIKLLVSWQDIATASDERGNIYRAIDFGYGFSGFNSDFDDSPEDQRFNRGCDTSAILARNLRLHPFKPYITYLFFEKPAGVSKELRVTIPKIDNMPEDTRFRIPITRQK